MDQTTLISDIDLNTDSVNVEDVNLSSPTVEAGYHASALAAQSTLLSNNPDVFDEYQRQLREANKASSLRTNYGQYLQGQAEIATSIAKDELSNQDSELGPLALENLALKQNALMRAELDPNGPEKAVVEELSAYSEGEDLDYKLKLQQEEAFKLASENDLRQIIGDAGWFDLAVDAGTFFVPVYGQLSHIKDINDISTSLQDKGLEFAEDTTDLRQIVMNYHSLPVSKRAEYWPTLKASILEAADENELSAVEFLQAFLDPIEGADSLILSKKLDAATALVDVAGIGAIRKLLTKVVTNGGLIRKAKVLGDTGKAAEMNVAAMVDKEVAQGVGTDKHTAVTNAQSFAIPKELDPKYVEGLNTESLTKLAEYQDKLSGVYTDWKNNDLTIRYGVLNDVEKKLALEKRIAELKANPLDEDPDSGIFIREGYHLSDIKMGELNEEFGTVTFKAVDPITKQTVNGAWKINWQEGDVVNDYTKTVEYLNEPLEKFGWPSLWSRNDEAGGFLDEAQTALALDSTETVVRGTLYDLVHDAYSTISGPKNIFSQKKVNRILQHGDEYFDDATGIRGKEFTAEELQNGVETRWGHIKLTKEKELEAYFKVRQLTRFMHHVRDNQLARQLTIRGFRNVTIGADTHLGKPYEGLSEALGATQGNKNIRIFDTLRGEVSNLSEEALKRSYDEENKVLVRLDQDSVYRLPVSVKDKLDDEAVRWVLVDKSAVTGIPSKGVLPYKPGYMPKINEGYLVGKGSDAVKLGRVQTVQWLVKEKIPLGKIDGEPSFIWKTHRFSGSKKDADKYLVYLQEKAAANGASPDEAFNKYRVFSDREQLGSDLEGETAVLSRGMFTGARSSDDILYGPPHFLNEGDRLGMVDSLQRYMSNLSRVMTRQEWRMGMEEKWVRTARSKLGNNNVTTFYDTVLPDTKEGRALEQLRKQIKFWNSIPTRDENAMENLIQNVHDWALDTTRKVPGFKNKQNIKSLLWLKHADPFSAARSAAFHPLLGMYNPVQLFVQAQPMSVALSTFRGLHAEDSLLSVKDAIWLSIFDNVQDPNAARAMYKAFKKDGELSHLAEIHEAWLKTGLAESIRTNPDIEAITKGRYFTKSMLARTLGDPLVFYRMGELANRRVSFAMAYRTLARDAGGKPDLKKVLTLTNKYMGELGRANQAHWQGGPNQSLANNMASVLLQFKQVIGKTAHTFMFRSAEQGGFTKEQRMKIWAGQAFLYGTAGLPLATVVGRYAASQMEDFSTLSEEEKASRLNAWNQFAVGILAKDILGSDVEVAKRGAVLSGATEEFENYKNIVQDLVFGNTGRSQGLTFAFGTILGRTNRAIQNIEPIVVYGMNKKALTEEELAMAIGYISEISSTGTNLKKAMQMRDNNVLLSNGKLIDINEYSSGTIIGTAIGFRPTVEEETRQLELYNKNREARYSATAAGIERIWYDQVVLGQSSDPEKAIAAAATIKYFVQDMDDKEVDQVMKIMHANIMTNATTAKQKALKTFFEKDGPSQLQDGWLQLEGLVNKMGLSPVGMAGAK